MLCVVVDEIVRIVNEFSGYRSLQIIVGCHVQQKDSVKLLYLQLEVS